MPNAAPKQQPRTLVDIRERTQAFPSDRMAKKVFYARFGDSHRAPHIDEILAIEEELRIHFRDTIYEMSRFIGNQELPIVTDGDMPTMDFATRMLRKLHIVRHRNEDRIIALMGSELMAWMIHPSPKIVPINGSYELACDHKGDTLILRPKTVDQEQAAA